jgi:hypothetical protein
VLAFERHYQTEIQGEYWVFRRLGLVSRDDLQILKKKKKKLPCLLIPATQDIEAGKIRV